MNYRFVILGVLLTTACASAPRNRPANLPETIPEINPAGSTAFEHIQIGKILLYTDKNPDAALQEFRVAASLLPKTDGGIYTEIARALAALGRNEEAVVALDTALLRDSTLTAVYFEMARLYSVMGKNEELRNTMHKAARAMPENENLRNAVAAMDAMVAKSGVGVLSGQVTKIEENDVNPAELANVANERIKAGQLKEAVIIIRSLPRMRPDSAGAWGTVAAISAKAGYQKEAVAAWKRALELDSKYFADKPEEEKIYKELLSLVGSVPPATLKSAVAI